MASRYSKVDWLKDIPGNPLIVAEVKDRTPFDPNYKVPDRYVQLKICEEVGDIISIHTNPLWGGSYEWLAEVCKRVKKPVLAKGFHSTVSEVDRAIECGATYVLTVDYFPGEGYENICWHECGSLHQLAISDASYRVWNSRDPHTGKPKNIPETEIVKANRWHKENRDGWLCRASNITEPEDVNFECSALLISRGLYQ